MRRQGSLLAVAVGLCTSLVPACTHLTTNAGPALTAAKGDDVSPAASQASPYHPIPTTLAVYDPSAGDGPSTIKPVYYPTPLPERPEPAPLPVLPPPTQVAEATPEILPVVHSLTAPAEVPEEPLLTALRCYLNKHPADAVDALKRYDKPNQDVLVGLVPLAARLTEGSVSDATPQDLSHLLDRINNAVTPLRQKAALDIEKISFCREIKTFGVYDPWPEDHAFQAGVDDRPGDLVQVYVELRNFTSEVQGPFYVTRLAGSVKICNYQKETVWYQACPAQPDRSQTLRQDYFINCHFCVPPHLPPGAYTLWIEVKDVATGRVVKRSLDFRVAANGAA